MINLANTISQGKMKRHAAAMRFFKLFFAEILGQFQSWILSGQNCWNE